MSDRIIMGVNPWLPWPLNKWRSWTEPVRAERLAALRIGIALVVAFDVATCYLPMVHDYFGPDSLSRIGKRDLFANLARPPRYNWSILRGCGHPLNFSLALSASVLATAWVLSGLIRSLHEGKGYRKATGLPWAVFFWIVATVTALIGLWARLRSLPDAEGPLRLASAGVVWALATSFLILALTGRRARLSERRDRFLPYVVGAAWLVATIFLLLALWAFQQDRIDADEPMSLYWALGRWDENPDILGAAMVVYLVAAICLCLGWRTRASAIATWLLSTSFDNLNPYLESNGDVIRGILLFYLMVCPCGAAWSVDAWHATRTGRPRGPVHVYPWVLRLLFLQMMILYGVNGLYKLSGETWRQGDSLYYVMTNLTLSRISFAQFHLPLPILRFLTWLVLVFEAGFPLLVLLPRSRTVTLLFGVAFHLGIWATMELGSFAPCALCMYLPLAPWERWVDRWRRSIASKGPLQVPPPTVIVTSPAGAAQGGGVAGGPAWNAGLGSPPSKSL
jgi:uncharacterized membrane protein YphA (DoxX/SURF4 family)